MAARIAINGFGRIGRQIARIMLSGGGAGLELVAVNTLESVAACANLLKYDSLYGSLQAEIEAEQAGLLLNGNSVRFSRARDPEDLKWRDLDVDLVIDCSGATPEGLQAHLRQGAAKVIASGHIPGADIIICMGVNEQSYLPARHHIVCAGSCTTSCIAPAAKVIDDHFSIEHLFATVIHSFTIGQSLQDGEHADLRRGRAVAANMIPTTTSASQQLGMVLPRLAGRFTGMAMRVPTPVVHAADLIIKVQKPGNSKELLAAFEEEAKGNMAGIISVSRAPLVSSDFKGSPFSCIIDAEFTGFHNDMIKAVLWHDNEHGYSSRVLDLARLLTA
jgi:glyceraldehyde 3-phosphate dehydrogenase